MQPIFRIVMVLPMCSNQFATHILGCAMYSPLSVNVPFTYRSMDGGYAGPKLRGKLEKIGCWTMEIVKRSDKAKGFEVIPRRWVVERTFAWLGRCRRLAKDWEKSILSAESWLLIAHIKLVTRRLARL